LLSFFHSYQDLDISLLSFLTEFERNALFTDINLVLKSEYIHYSDMAHLSYILPMMTSIESVSIHAVNGTDLLKFFYSDLITEWTMPMLTSTRRLYAWYDFCWGLPLVRRVSNVLIINT
jgi:hypothetical protein